MPDHIDDARRLIQSRLAEIEAEASRLQSALASMGEGNDTPRRRPRSAGGRRSTPTATKAKARASGRRKASRRAPRGQRREELLVAIGENPGARPSDLAASIGIKATQVHALIAKVRAEKLVVKRGKGYALKA